MHHGACMPRLPTILHSRRSASKDPRHADSLATFVGVNQVRLHHSYSSIPSATASSPSSSSSSPSLVLTLPSELARGSRSKAVSACDTDCRFCGGVTSSSLLSLLLSEEPPVSASRCRADGSLLRLPAPQGQQKEHSDLPGFRHLAAWRLARARTHVLCTSV